MNNRFIEKEDYFGIADTTNLVCVNSDDGRTNEYATATGQDGSYVAGYAYGEKLSPSNEYAMKAVTLTKVSGDIAIGQINTVTDGEDVRSICLGQFDINTAAGEAPTYSASGEEVEENASNACQYSLPAFTVTKKHHAQVLFGAFNSTGYGEGVHLKSASYSASGSITKGEKEGKCLTHDIIEGQIECAVEFVSVNGVKPTLSAGTGWEISQCLACSNPDADWPTWTATLVTHLQKDA